MQKLIRITTIPLSLNTLLRGQSKFMTEQGFEVIGISSPGKELEEVRNREGIRTITVAMTRSITPFRDLKALFQLIGILKKEAPDIVHTHTPKAGLLGMMAARIAGVPHRLHTVAGLPLMVETGFKRRLLEWMEQLTYAFATKVYPNSQQLQKFILKHRFSSPDKLKVIGRGSSNGIDTTRFDPKQSDPKKQCQIREELGIKKEDFVFLFVGRIVKDKGIEELINAFTAVQQQRESAHLILAGIFEQKLDPLKQEVAALMHHHPHIHFVGFQPDVLDYFALADVFTFPSYREGFPNVVMEAAAMQLNCVVTDINGCNEIITQGENGWIIPVEDTEALKDRMLWCLDHPAASKEMGLGSRKIMQMHYERRCVWEALLKEYKGLLYP